MKTHIPLHICWSFTQTICVLTSEGFCSILRKDLIHLSIFIHIVSFILNNILLKNYNFYSLKDLHIYTVHCIYKTIYLYLHIDMQINRSCPSTMTCPLSSSYLLFTSFSSEFRVNSGDLYTLVLTSEALGVHWVESGWPVCERTGNDNTLCESHSSFLHTISSLNTSAR